MTTGRINQVTVLHARTPRVPHLGSGYRGLHPLPGQSLVTDRSKVDHPRPAGARRRPAKGQFRQRASQGQGVPSPPFSHASGALRPVRRTGFGPFGEDYRRAAAPPKRAARTRRISDWFITGCRLSWPTQAINPHPSTPTASASKALSGSNSQAPRGIPHFTRARPQLPFPSGHILQGRRIDRSDSGRPAVPKRHFRSQGTSAIGQSRHRSPGGPSTLSRRPAASGRASVLSTGGDSFASEGWGQACRSCSSHSGPNPHAESGVRKPKEPQHLDRTLVDPSTSTTQVHPFAPRSDTLGLLTPFECSPSM